MHARTHDAPSTLGPRESLLLEDAVGMEIVCRAGRLWLTQHGDVRDVVLRPGQAFEITLPSCLIMSDGAAATFLLRPMAPPVTTRPRPGWLRRLADALDPRSGGTVQGG